MFRPLPMLCALAALALLSPAKAAVTSNFDSTLGILFIGVTDFDTATLSISGGQVRVNGAAPGGVAVAATAVTSIFVTSDATGNTVNFSGVSAASFPNIDQIQVNLGAGDHTFSGSDMDEAVAIGAGSQLIKCGDGDDLIIVTDASALTNSGLEGNAGTDVVQLLFGEGNDTLSFAAAGQLLRMTRAGQIIDIEGTEEVAVTLGGGNDTATLGNLSAVAGVPELSFDLGTGDDTLNAGACPAGALARLTVTDTETGTNTVTGSGGLNSITMGPGNDTVTARGTNTSMTLGDGDNTLIMDFVAGPISNFNVAAGSGTDVIKVTVPDCEAILSQGTQADRTNMDLLFMGGTSNIVVFTSFARVEMSSTERLTAEIYPLSPGNVETVTVSSAEPMQLSVFDLPGTPTSTTIGYDGNFNAPRIERSGGVSPSLITGTNVQSVTLNGNNERNSYATGTLPEGSATAAGLTINSSDGNDEFLLSSLPANIALTANGGGGGDSMLLGEGTVQATGGPGNDLIQDGAGSATLGGDEDDDAIFPGGGDDTVTGGGGHDFARWSPGDGGDFFSVDDLELDGNAEAEEQRVFLAGSPGPGNTTRLISWAVGTGVSESIGIGDTAKISLRTGIGEDSITALGWNGTLPLESLEIALSSGDSLVDLRGLASDCGIAEINVFGDEGEDTLYAANVPTNLFGAGANDELIAGASSGELDGGPGNDLLRISPSLAEPVAEYIIGGGEGDDTLRFVPISAIAAVEFRPEGPGSPLTELFLPATASVRATVSLVEQIEVVPPLNFSIGTSVTLQAAIAGVTEFRFPGSGNSSTDAIRVVGSDGFDAWLVEDETLDPTTGPTVTIGALVDDATFDLAGGDDLVLTDSSTSTERRFIGGEGTDRFEFDEEGLLTTVTRNGSTRTWQQPLRASVTAEEFELFPAEQWSLF